MLPFVNHLRWSWTQSSAENVKNVKFKWGVEGVQRNTICYSKQSHLSRQDAREKAGALGADGEERAPPFLDVPTAGTSALPMARPHPAKMVTPQSKPTPQGEVALCPLLVCQSTRSTPAASPALHTSPHPALCAPHRVPSNSSSVLVLCPGKESWGADENL